MPRQARAKSESGIYHVMLRGINKQQIFEDEEDNEKFIQVLRECKAISEFELFAYCLMGNHIHLLIKPGKEPIEQVFKRIGGRFVYWYNIKYQRTGHLFQDRFKSEPVEDDSYFLTVIRYIHQNPVKAGICKAVDRYRFSSYHKYINDDKLVDSEFVFNMISKEEFIRYNNENSNDKCLDLNDDTPIIRVTDEQAQAIIYKVCKCKNVAEFQMLKTETRAEMIRIFNSKSLSIRQTSRLTGISVGIVRKYLNT